MKGVMELATVVTLGSNDVVLKYRGVLMKPARLGITGRHLYRMLY